MDREGDRKRERERERERERVQSDQATLGEALRIAVVPKRGQLDATNNNDGDAYRYKEGS